MILPFFRMKVYFQRDEKFILFFRLPDYKYPCNVANFKTWWVWLSSQPSSAISTGEIARVVGNFLYLVYQTLFPRNLLFDTQSPNECWPFIRQYSVRISILKMSVDVQLKHLFKFFSEGNTKILCIWPSVINLRTHFMLLIEW